MKLILTIFYCCIAMLCDAQEQTVLFFTPLQKIGEEVLDFTSDNLGNIYVLTPTNQIKKLNEKGDSIAVYNDVKRYGKIYSIDATNPLKVLVYYKDFSTVIILDRLLNVRATIDLRRQNILQVSAIASSYDNNTWVFDELDSKLKKIDDNGKVLFESADFRQLFDTVPSPEKMYDRDGQLYLYDPGKGLLVFDYYGARKNNYQLLHLEDLQVIDKNTVTARDSVQIVLYKPITLQLHSFSTTAPIAASKKISFNGNLLYCLSKTGQLEVFKVLQ